MSLFSRLLRPAILVSLAALPGAGVAQGNPQFIQPAVQSTGGRVTGFAAGSFQRTPLSGSPDLLYVNAFTTTGTTYSVLAGTLLTDKSHAFTNLVLNQIVFANTLAATAAVADFDGDTRPDFAFALSPTSASGTNLCIIHGTGSSVGGGSSFGATGCTAFAIHSGTLPNFGYIAAFPFKKNLLPQVIVEDSAYNYLYVVSNNGNLGGFAVTSEIAIPAADGPGPIFTGDFNNDGNTDFIVNSQTSNVATLYFGKGDGTFQAPIRLPFTVHSMLLQDMDGDTIPDAIVEGNNGVIGIFKGSYSNTAPFASVSEGGTAGADGHSGNGGHLAAIADVNGDGIADILTTTPIGLSVLLGQGGLRYNLRGIYNVGPGRSTFSVADFNGDGNPDLYVDSPEGVAIVLGNPDGSFQTSSAYSAGLPALGATIVDVNSDNKPDVVVGTGAVQAQVLTGSGNGSFTMLAAPTNATGVTVVTPQASLWSSILTGDFDGDGCPDLLYSLTGLPLPTPGSGAGTGLYLQYGNRPSGKCDATFQPPQPITTQSAGAPADNNFYGESAVADLNGDGIADIANIDTFYYSDLVSQKAGGALTLGKLNIKEDAGSLDESSELDSFSQVAAGFFSTGRSNMQDLVFQDDASITPYVNNRDGSFTAMPGLSQTPGASTLYGGTILLADIDGDGHGDIIIPYHNLSSMPASPRAGLLNQLYIWYGNGDGTFGAPQITPLSRNYYLAQVMDMNGDGLPDLVLSDGYLVSILYNQSGHVFGGEQHFLAGQGINSLSVADVNNDGALDLVVANGGATISNAVAIGGKALSAITLTPNPDVNTGGITVLLNNIKTKPVTGPLTASPEPSNYQASFTLTATLVPTAGVALPTGTVTFSIDGTQVGTPAPVVVGTGSSSATYIVPAGNAYQGGPHTLTATYNGDPFNSPLPLSGAHAVTGSGTTTNLYLCVGPALGCPLNTPVLPPFMATLPMFYGQYFNGTATVISNDGSTLDPASFIAFNDAYNGGPSMTLCTLKVGTASSCDPSIGTTVGTSVGVNVFTAVYSGDATHTPSSSPTVTITVLPDTNDAKLVGSPNPSPQGQPVTFTATFTGNVVAPVGQVTFSEFFPPTALGVLLGTATLVPGPGLTSTATFTTSTLPVGKDTITAAYAATLDFVAASATIIETINATIPTTTKLTSVPNPSIFSQSVTFTATVSTVAGPTPTGTVTFFDIGVPLGTVPLVNGVAIFTTAVLPPGSDPITATFSGDLLTAPSSGTLTQIVNPLPPPGSVNFTITVTPSPIVVGVGNAAAVTVTVTPLQGFTQPVTLSCSNLPYESACTFTSITIPAGGGSTKLLLSTMAPHNCGSTQPYFTGSNTQGLAPLAVPALAGLAVLFIPGKRRWLRSLIAIVAIAGAMQITGCGTCTDLGTRPTTYTIQIVGAASGTSEVEAQPVTLNVTI